jgi:hypothetical protein
MKYKIKETAIFKSKWNYLLQNVHIYVYSEKDKQDFSVRQYRQTHTDKITSIYICNNKQEISKMKYSKGLKVLDKSNVDVLDNFTTSLKKTYHTID